MSSTENAWEGDFNPLADPQDRRVLFGALDSFRSVLGSNLRASSNEKGHVFPLALTLERDVFQMVISSAL